MYDQDRALRFAAWSALENVDPAAGDLDAGPRRRIAGLDPARLNGGEDPERGDNDEGENEDRHRASERSSARLTARRSRWRP